MPEEKSLKEDRKSCAGCKKSFFVNLKVCPNCGEKNSDPFVGRTIAKKFFVESVIGEGGMGVVYSAVDNQTKQRVAVKILREQFMNDDIAVKRFKHEAIAASRLSHPHIVSLHDYGETVDGYNYMVMEIIEGKSLAKVVHERRSLSADRTVHIVTQVCDALEHAHERGVVHRDLKPGNILLTSFEDDQDYVKLVDFGIATLMVPDREFDDTQIEKDGEVLGSPLYMSPEQCLGRPQDGRSDIYSLAIVAYETLMGKVPFIGRTGHETIEMQLQNHPMSFASKRPDLTVSANLESAVFKALEKKPVDRPQSMQEFAQNLRDALSANVPPAPFNKSTASVGKPSLKATMVQKEKRGTKIALAIGLLAIVVIAFITLKLFLIK